MKRFSKSLLRPGKLATRTGYIAQIAKIAKRKRSTTEAAEERGENQKVKRPANQELKAKKLKG